jgi:hypothetical protein
LTRWSTNTSRSIGDSFRNEPRFDCQSFIAGLSR